MNTWTESEVKTALQQFVREGARYNWDQAVEQADGPYLLKAMAKQLQLGSEDEKIILTRLVPEVASRRPDLQTCFDYRSFDSEPEEGYIIALSRLKDLVKQGIPEPGSREELERKIQDRVSRGCEMLKITGRVRQDLLAIELDDVLTDRSLPEILGLNEQTAQQISWSLSDKAKPNRNSRSRLPAARRARLELQGAKILFVPPRPEDREQEIRRAIGSYCCRQAQVYAEDRSEQDVALDYALEAVRYQPEQRDFPTALYFHTALMQSHKQQGDDVLPYFNFNRDRAESVLTDGLDSYSLSSGHTSSILRSEDEQRLRTLGLALLRLALYDRSLALSLFVKLPAPVRSLYSEVLTRGLGRTFDKKLPQAYHFEALCENFRQRITALHDALRQATQAGSLKQIGDHSSQLEDLSRDTRSLVSSELQAAVAEIIQAAARSRQAAAEQDPASRRSLLRAAFDSLRHAPEQTHATSFGILYIDPIVRSWGDLIERGIADTTQSIRPDLRWHPYKNSLLRKGTHGLVQLKLRNQGKGVGTSIEVTASWRGVNLEAELSQPNLNPGQETVVVFSGPLAQDIRQVLLKVQVFCTDVEGSRTPFPEEPFEFIGAPPDFDFEEKKRQNPFNAGDVVKDPDMFMGRGGILQQLEDVISQSAHHGALRLLFGQKRVGKSSILYFLEQNLLARPELPILCAHVTWLNFPRHRPGHVVFEIAKKVVRSAAAQGIALPPPCLDDYNENYSLCFNDLVDRLFTRTPGVRLAVLIDEFDKSLNQLTDPSLGYDESFFGYLRGLTQTDGVTLVLAGGEELPNLLRELGPTFNNALRIRVSYLDEESVKKLIRNKYVPWLDFPDPVVAAIVHLTHGNPFFTQHVCKELYDGACDLHALQVARHEVEEVGRRLVSGQLTTEQMAHLYQVEGDHGGLEPALLFLLSREATLFESPVVHSDSLVSQVRSDAASVRQSLTTLIEREVVRNVPERPSHVQIVMPLFAAWFKENCPLTSGAWNLLTEMTPT